MSRTLLVSGIIYTPYGDEELRHADHKNVMKNQKVPLPIVAAWDRRNFGTILDIKREFYKGVPIYYGLGILKNKEAIIRLLLSTIKIKSKFKNYSLPTALHSWCAGMEYEKIYEKTKKNKNIYCFWDRDPITNKPIEKLKYVYKDTRERNFIGFDSCHVVNCPCVKYTSIWLPNTAPPQNKNLMDLHSKEKMFGEHDKQLMEKIKLDNFLFNDLFGKHKINQSKLINVGPEHLEKIIEKHFKK